MTRHEATGFKLTKDWVLAGHAIFTVHNNKGEHYTFRIVRKEANEESRAKGFHDPVWFASLLSGPENDTDYTYMGMVAGANGRYPYIRTTKASRMSEDSKPVQVLQWALQLIWRDEAFPEGYGANGAGRCGRCGRTLTRPEGVDPEGFRYGYGPECWGKIQGGAA